jgi:hypothetical protein
MIPINRIATANEQLQAAHNGTYGRSMEWGSPPILPVMGGARIGRKAYG